jgi:hypothetical protein
MDATHFWHTLLFASLGLCGVTGLLALVSPRLFTTVASSSSRWINSRRFFEYFDRQFNVDQFVLPHSRLLGVLVLASVAVLWYAFRVA